VQRCANGTRTGVRVSDAGPERNLSSDVTVKATVNTNPGTTAAAGVVPGASFDRRGASNAAVGECDLSRSDAPFCLATDRRRVGETAARQWLARSRLRVVPRSDATTKGLTGFMSPHDGEAGEVHVWTGAGVI